VQNSELCSLIDDDVAPGQQAAAHVDEVSVCSFRPAGPGSRNPSLNLQLASADQSGIVKLWDCDGGRLLYSLQGHSCRVYTCAWSPDGSMLAAACLQGKLVIWDVHNGNEVKQYSTGAGFFELSWNSDGQRLAGAAKDGVRIWDVRK
jgi:transducin (beta)-like 1